jgi:hypothetical protein
VMADKRIIVVVGATGAQGGGLARAILNAAQSAFSVRALTRDVNSEKAQALAKEGAEVVAADLDNSESLNRAFAGAYGAYCVTFYWAHMQSLGRGDGGIVQQDPRPAGGLQRGLP